MNPQQEDGILRNPLRILPLRLEMRSKTLPEYGKFRSRISRFKPNAVFPFRSAPESRRFTDSLPVIYKQTTGFKRHVGYY